LHPFNVAIPQDPFPLYDVYNVLNPLNAELNSVCHLLALLGAHHIFHVSRIRVKKFKVDQKGRKNVLLLTAIAYKLTKDF